MYGLGEMWLRQKQRWLYQQKRVQDFVDWVAYDVHEHDFFVLASADPAWVMAIL